MKQVAIVEDNADNRLLLRAILSGRYELTEYEDGREALACMEAVKPHLVLLDISLPEMDGIEVLGRIRGNQGLQADPRAESAGGADGCPDGPLESVSRLLELAPE